MGRHKKHTKKHRRRSRHVGALGLGTKGAGLKLLTIGAGFLLADQINAQIDKVLPKTTDTATNTQVPNNTIGIIGQLGVGGLLLLKKKSPGTMGTVMTAAGGLLVGSGIKRTLKQMKVITGYQAVPVIGKHSMAGYQAVPVIGNTVVPPQLSGKMPAQLQGYRVSGYGSQGSGSGTGLMTSSGYLQ